MGTIPCLLCLCGICRQKISQAKIVRIIAYAYKLVVSCPVRGWRLVMVVRTSSVFVGSGSGVGDCESWIVIRGSGVWDRGSWIGKQPFDGSKG